MITVLIVEDERVIRVGMEKHIPWKELEIEKLYVAEQAEQAIEICETVEPNLIISDIRMPGMNGIELCRLIKKKYPNIQIIFVTGFADKEYLKAAISLSAVSYVEKPINTQELSQAIKNAIEKIKKLRTYENAIAHSIFTKSDKIDYEWSCDKYFSVGMLYFKEHKTGNEIETDIFRKFEQVFQEQGFHTYTEIIDNRTIAFLFADVISGKDRFEDMQDTLENYICNYPEDCFFVLGKEVENQREIKLSYESAENLKLCVGFKGWNKVATYGEHFSKSVNREFGKKALHDFTIAVTQKNVMKAAEIVKEFTTEIQKKHLLLDMDVRYWYYFMESEIYRLAGIKKEETGEKIEELETVEELEKYICSLLQMETAENDHFYIAQKVADYIRDHYDEKDLSIKTLADIVYLTPTYLSNLYKKQTGVTIGQYLVDVRIEHAVRLLQDPQWKLYQIAPMVGYEDANYFAKIFKKKKGITPSEYREKMIR